MGRKVILVPLYMGKPRMFVVRNKPSFDAFARIAKMMKDRNQKCIGHKSDDPSRLYSLLFNINPVGNEERQIYFLTKSIKNSFCMHLFMVNLKINKVFEVNAKYLFRNIKFEPIKDYTDEGWDEYILEYHKNYIQTAASNFNDCIMASLNQRTPADVSQ